MDIENKKEDIASFLIFTPVENKCVVISYCKHDIDKQTQLDLSNQLFYYINSNKENLVSNTIITPKTVTIIHCIDCNQLSQLQSLMPIDILDNLESRECDIISIDKDTTYTDKHCIFNANCVNKLRYIMNHNNKKEVLNIIEG
jgi:hypothetical protein